jgi:2-oxoglutarate dehydrogenase E2 component (dihydrolipoamide succinyltransferase)
MSIEIKVPNLPESVSSATVATWHLKAGDTVKREQNLMDLETDKVMLEVPSTVDGVLKEIRVQAGATVQAGDVLGILEEGTAAAVAPAPAAAAPATAPAKAAAATPAAAASSSAAAADEGQSPAVRKLLSELGLSAAQISGSGKGGRLTVEDVKAHAAKPAVAPAAKLSLRRSSLRWRRVPPAPAKNNACR